MLRAVALVRTDVSKELIAFIIRVTRIGDLGTTSAVFLHRVLRLLVTAKVVPSAPIPVILMMEAIISSEMLVLTRSHDVTSQNTAFLLLYSRHCVR
jgi:hypothetical protein